LAFVHIWAAAFCGVLAKDAQAAGHDLRKSTHTGRSFRGTALRGPQKFSGVLIVLRPGFRELSIGHLCAAIGGLAAAIGIVINRALGAKEKRISLYGAGLFGTLIVSGLLMLSEVSMPTAWQWLFLASYGLLGAVGNVLLMTAARMVAANLVAPPQYSQMIWAIGFGYLLFNDDIDLPMALGIALIIFSGLLTLARERTRGTPLPTAVTANTQAALATAQERPET